MNSRDDDLSNEGKKKVDEPRGVGRLVETTVPEPIRNRRRDPSGVADEITEASEESFPASDPPAYADGHAEPVDIEPGSQVDDEARRR